MWQIVYPYLNMLSMGFVSALPSIVAVIGIVVNNWKAHKRDVDNREINIKLDVLENIYTRFQEANHNEILFYSAIRDEQSKMIDELLQYGTNNIIGKINNICYENTLNIIDMIMYKQEIRKLLDIDISFDRYLDIQRENYSKILAQTKVIDDAVRIMIKNYKIDRLRFKEMTIGDLKEIKEGEQLGRIDMDMDELSEKDKHIIKESAYGIIQEYEKSIDYNMGSEESTKIEKELAEKIHKLIKEMK